MLHNLTQKSKGFAGVIVQKWMKDLAQRRKGAVDEGPRAKAQRRKGPGRTWNHNEHEEHEEHTLPAPSLFSSECEQLLAGDIPKIDE
jgi:hypothetical protein